MVAHVLIETGHAPAYLIGGELRTTGRNAAWGDGDWIVVEADESDRSFLKLAPEVAVVTNVELDHHATYRTPSEIEEAFREFAAAAGRTIAWEGAGVDADVTYGIADASALRDVRLQVPGEHNVLNALAALLACREAGVEPGEAAGALATFSGAGRRFERVGTTAAGAVVYDDYAHHPTEVRATIEAARTLGPRRLVACFQPHLYSRTERLRREFGRALALADAACVLDVYPARERAEDHPGVRGLRVAEAAADHAGGRTVAWLPGFDDAERFLRAVLRQGDVLLTLGAGDVDALGRRLLL
jgi:UDP-N-acetylmuramate--alanine ligase